MKYLSIFLLFFLFQSANAQQFEWVRSGTGTGVIQATDIISDPSGSNYTVGFYSGNATFGGASITSAATQNMFLVKHLSNGSVVWALRTATINDLTIGLTNVTSDHKGSVYVSGVFSGTTTIGSQSLTSAGSTDIFIAKYDTNGNFKWAIRGGQSTGDVATGICVDSLGYIHVCGYWNSSNPFQIGSFSLPTSGFSSFNPFHIKLRSDGSIVWLHNLNNQRASVNGIESDRFGNLYIIGWYGAQFGASVTFGSSVLTCNEGTSESYTAKMDSNGTFLWGQKAGGQSADNPSDLSVGTEGTVYFTGFTTGSIQFDDLQFNRQDGWHIFTVCYKTDGTVAWAKVDSSDLSFLSTNYLAVDAAENLYETGGYSEMVIFNSKDTLNVNGPSDVYFVNHTPDHSYRWAKRAGGAGTDIGYGITVSPNGEIYACGAFSGTSYFDTLSITSGGSTQNAYIAKLFTTRINTNLFAGSYCAGTAISASFTIKGKFEEGNIFSIQLSDTTGSFINSQVIGSLSSTTPTTIIGSLPIDLPASKKYRIRVVGSNPRTIGTDGSFFTVFAAPKVKFDPPSPIKVCNSTFPITVNVTGGKSYEWRDGSTATNRSITTPGWYYVTASNEATCDRTDSIQVVSVPAAVASITPTKPTTFCEGGSVGLIAGGGQFFKWSTGDTVRVLTATKQGWYSVAVTDTNGCSDVDSIFVTVTPAPKISITPDGEVAICPGDSITITATSSPNYLWSTGDTTASIKIGKNGLYYVSTSDSNHCSGTSNTLKVTMNIPPQKPVITRDSNILYTSAPKPLQWYFNGELIPGATDNTLIATKEGNYTVRTTDGNNCSTISDGFAFVFNSVKKQNSITSVIASPNPFNDDLSISITLAKQTDCTVELYSVLGVKVANIYDGIIAEGKTMISYNFTEQLTKGPYYLRVKSGNQITTIKLIAE
jgi:hypothetical protein